MAKSVLSLLLAVFLATTSGCVALVAGAAAGAGTAVWISNKLSQEVNGSTDRVATATRQALADLNLPVTKETREDQMVQIRSEYLNNEPVFIDIRAVSTSVSRLEVRVGMVGDREATRKVFNAILKRL